MKYAKSLMFSGLICGALIACGESTPEAEAPEAVPAEAPPPPMPPPMPETSAGEATGSAVPSEPAPPPAPEPLTDEQIAAVTDAANNAEIEQAKLAQKKGKHARVKKFAATMIQHHTQAKQKQAKVLKTAKMTPAESTTSTQLTEDAARMTETLKTAEGPDFDKAYIDAQVEAHRKVLETFDKQLIPNAQTAELKAALEEFRPKIEAHLTEAQEIQQLLAAAPADAAGGASGAAGGSKAGGAASAGAGAGTKGAGAGTGAGAGGAAKPATGGTK